MGRQRRTGARTTPYKAPHKGGYKAPHKAPYMRKSRFRGFCEAKALLRAGATLHVRKADS